jgi:hypothetical protein
VIAVWSGDDWTGGVKRTLATVYEDVDLYRYFIVASNGKRAPLPGVYEALLRKMPPRVASDVKAFQGPVLGNRDTILNGTPGVPLNTDVAPYSEYFLGSLLRRPPTLP